jgi:MSHA pilin protein MshA
MKNKTSQSGFTLIELIAVMVILGILAAVIIPRITTITSGAYESNVRNMYGLIKNEVTAQAVKAAMSGNFLETYPDITNNTDDAILKLWVSDYDPDGWSQVHFAGEAAKLGDNSANDVGNGMATVNALAFMYHPHGKPAAATVDVHGHAADFNPDGTSTSIEDIYWIVYYPRTSEDGEDFGRDLDGFVMAAFKDGGDKDLEATIDADGTTIAAAGDDTLIPDLNHCLCPGG